MEDYRNKVKGVLEKVIKGEKVYVNPPKPLEEKIKEVGAEKYIRNIFGNTPKEEVINESIEEEIEQLQKPKLSEDPQRQIIEDDLLIVPDRSAAPNVYRNWIKILPMIKRLGSVDESGPNFARLKFMGRDDEPNAITAHLMKHKDSETRTFLKVSFDNDEDQTNTELAIDYFKGLGIDIDPNTIIDKPEYVIFEVLTL